MKKSSYFLLLTSFIFLLFASCDKIDESQYIVYSGVEGAWTDGNGVSDQTQRAIIEKYTGVRCINCPTADEAINAAVTQYNGKLIAVAIHDSSFAFTRPIGGSPDLRSAPGNTWSKYFGVFDGGQYPTALVNRTPAGAGWDLFNPLSGINSHVDPIVNQSTAVAVQVDAQNSQEGISVTVNLEFLEKINDKLSLTLFIMEDGIVATQRMPDGTDNEGYIHNHVLRQVITDLWGTEVDCNGDKGEKRMANFSYTDADGSWDLSKCHIVALISNKDTRQILNVAECEIE